MTSQLLIAIDYDDTFTADPDLWTNFIKDVQANMHTVVCITWRHKDQLEECRRSLPEGVELHSAYGMSKKKYAKKYCLPIDIWIDDSPESIVQ